ncbi:MAG: hypothetical protein KAH56_13995, partial [Candidatus Krumholzibacteria bacterium]|nr:hypothetical protein [Candidatus Krumholzibacteria bacterium]
MKRLILTMPALLLMLAAVTVLADVRYEPVEITLINPLRPAQVGEEYQDVLRVESFGDHVITDLDLSGQGWKVNPLGFSGHRFVGKGEVLEIPFSAVPGNPDQPLILSWYVDDQYREMVIDRSQAA